MSTSVSFAEFTAASPYRDPVDHKKLRFVYRALEDLAAERRVLTRDLAILELACGAGGITLPLARTGARVRAIDIDAADVARLNATARERGYRNLDASVEDAYTFRSDDRFDVIIASEVLEHVLEPARLLQTITHHLAPGGVVVVTTPNGFGPWELSNALKPHHVARRWNWLRRAAGKPPYVAGAGPDHCQRFTRGKLERLFRENGLDIHRFMNSDFVLTMFPPLRRNRMTGTFDADLANVVPHWMASGWYVSLRRRG